MSEKVSLHLLSGCKIQNVNNVLFRIRFGTAHLKCQECRVCVHVDCKDQFKFACVPQSAGTPTRKGEPVDISNYAPTNSPMVPGIIVHCINEVILIKYFFDNEN